MITKKEMQYAFVIDKEGKKLSPTPVDNAWYLIRKDKAELIEQYPMVIRLNKTLPQRKVDDNPIVLGIDDGAHKVGIALVQRCKTKNKVLFKGVIDLRQDVSKKMDERRGYRRYRRSHKRYREKRFDNRGSSKRKGRIPPSIYQKKEAILRVVKRLNKYVRIDKIIIEDVAIDIRALTEGYKPYKWQYQKSNRLDENLRRATFMRDDYTCQMCGKNFAKLEAHHIVPLRDSGSNSIYNLITLCCDCHEKVTGNESEYKEKFLNIIEGRELDLKPAMHVMQGKSYLRSELKKIANLEITDGGTTANKRIDYGISKSHTDDAICITGLLPVDTVDVKEVTIKPIRTKKKNRIEELEGFQHRDIIRYTKRDGTKYEGYITALRIKNNKYNSKVCNFRSFSEKTYRGYGFRNLTLINRPKGLMFI